MQAITMKTYGHWIDGQDVQPASGQWFDSTDPYRGVMWARIARGNAADVNRAVESAHRRCTKGHGAK
jgi:(Z)-2-((N-methylformamido)methylene)-5-hydroxybutyrolactone dehydrogenase